MRELRSAHAATGPRARISIIATATPAPGDPVTPAHGDTRPAELCLYPPGFTLVPYCGLHTPALFLRRSHPSQTEARPHPRIPDHPSLTSSDGRCRVA